MNALNRVSKDMKNYRLDEPLATQIWHHGLVNYLSVKRMIHLDDDDIKQIVKEILEGDESQK